MILFYIRGSMMKSNQEKIAEWRNLIEEQKLSKLTIRQFCTANNLTPSQFYYFKKEIAKNDISKANIKPEKSIELKPIHVTHGSKEMASIRFILPNGMQCILPKDISVNEIKAIL